MGIRDITGYSKLTDSELDAIVGEFRQLHGIASGRSLLIGYLRSRNIRIQQNRVAQSLVRVDPSNSRLRWASLIQRRKYSVAAPNSLWHLDGHHSLVN